MIQKTNPLVSVVIATRNEERNIARILQNLGGQTYTNMDVVVVDNGSADHTRELAKNENVRVFNLPEHISLDGIKNFRGAQVNFGVSQCHGDIIFYPDADMTFESGLVEEAVSLLQQNDALFIPEIVLGRGILGHIRRFERSFYNATCIDAPRFVSRKMFDSAGGFDTKNIPFGPDDWDMHKSLKKAGARLSITKAVKFHHEEWMDFGTYLRKKADYIHTFEPYISKWGQEDPDVRRQMGIYYRFFGVFMENGKWQKLFIRPDLTFAMYLLRFIVGARYVMKR